MRDKLNILFRASNSGTPQSAAASRTRPEPVEFRIHNSRNPVRISFKIAVGIESLGDYVLKKQKHPNANPMPPLEFSYVPQSVVVEGALPDHEEDDQRKYVAEFVRKFNGASPTFNVTLRNFGSIQRKTASDPERLRTLCKIDGITITNEIIDDLVLTGIIPNDSAKLTYNHKELYFRIHALLAPRRSLGQRVFHQDI